MCVRGTTQVWSVVAFGDYALVAAETKQKARELASTIEDGNAWAFRWTQASVSKLEGVFYNGTPRVLDYREAEK